MARTLLLTPVRPGQGGETAAAHPHAWLRNLVVGLTAFLTVVDLFATQAVLPSLAARYAVGPAAMGTAVNASTIGMAVSGLLVALFSRRIDRRRGIVLSLALLSIPMAVYVTIVAWPLLDSFYYSVTNWNGFSADYRIVGLENFRALYSDPLVRGALRNTMVWTVAAALLPNLLGLALAIALERHVPGSRLFKSIFYLPVCLSAVVVGQIWVWIYQPDWGALNGILRSRSAARAVITCASILSPLCSTRSHRP